MGATFWAELTNGWIDWDPAAGDDGRYTLVTPRTEGNKAYTEVFQRVGLNWVFQYEFDARDADAALLETWSATPPEVFHYGDEPGHLYIAFVASSSAFFEGNSEAIS